MCDAIYRSSTSGLQGCRNETLDKPADETKNATANGAGNSSSTGNFGRNRSAAGATGNESLD